MHKKDAKADLASRLRMARELAGLSQSQVAKRFEYHRPTISEIEAGRREVSAQELAKFADIYGVSPAWLLDQEPATNGEDANVLLAARELSKISDDDFSRLLKVIQILRKTTNNS